MEKTSTFDKNGVKKGAWSEEEDDKLRAYIQRYGHWNWGLLPKFAGLSRSGKSCRLRWMNYLRPNIKHGNFTKEEDDMIVHLHNKLGNKWSAIATNLPGRSDNEIKNRWHTHLKKRSLEDQTMLENNETLEQNQENPKENLYQEVEMLLMSDSPSSSSSSGMDQFSSSWLSCSELSDIDVATQSTPDYELAGDFWTEPFLPDITSSIDNTFSPMNLVDDFFISQSFSEDMMMTHDEFSWSTLDSYYEYNNNEFMDWPVLN